MPDSDTPVGWYPPGWTENVDDQYIQWTYEEDPTINVRITPSEDEPGLTVWASAGVTTDGEAMRFRPVQGLAEEEAFAVSLTLFSAMNGAIRRVNGDPQFNGDA